MRALVAAFTAFVLGCGPALNDRCFEAATEGECVEVEGPLQLPPQTAAGIEATLALCSAPCIKVRREVELTRNGDEPVPLLQKLQFPFVLSVAEFDHGKSLHLGPTPGLVSLHTSRGNALESLGGLEAPRLVDLKVSHGEALRNLAGLVAPTEGALSLSLNWVELEDLSGLEGFTRMVNLDVMFAPRLQSLHGVEGLVALDGLDLNSTGLTTLSHLNQDLRLAGFGSIRGNPALSACEAADVAARLAPPGRVEVSDNMPCP